MKKLSLLLVLICTTFQLIFSQTIGVDKLRSHGNSGWDLVSGMAIDNQGNYYITGSFTGQIDVGPTTLVSAGQRDIFIIKLDSLNNITWAKNYGGENDEQPLSICCDNTGKLYLSGNYCGTLDLAGAIQSQGTIGTFFAQLGQDGTVLWTKPLHSTSAVRKVLLQTDTDNNLWIGGSFENSLALNESTSLQSQSKLDAFIAKYGPAGELLAQRHLPGDGDENINAMVVDNDNNVYIGGSYEKTMVFTPATVNSYGKLDLFLAKFDSQGNRLWYRIAGNVYDDAVNSIALDGKGNIYVACGFELSTKIGPPVYNAAQGTDVILIKSTVSNGAPVWIKQLGGGSKNTATSLACGNGKVYLAGNFRGGFQEGDEYQSEGVFEDGYLARFSENGNFDWFQKAGGSKEDNLWVTYNKKTNILNTTGYYSDDFSIKNYQDSPYEFSQVFYGSLIDCDQLPKVNLGGDKTICYGTTIEVEGDYVNYSWGHGVITQSITPDTSGTYSILVEDKYGCQSTDNIGLIVNPLPVFELGGPITLPESATLFLDPGLNSENYTYLWSTGATGSTLSLPMGSLPLSSTIGLIVTDGTDNCQYTDEVLVSREEAPPAQAMSPPQGQLVSNNTGNTGQANDQTEETAGEEIQPAGYIIYPNPSSGKIFIKGDRVKEARQIDVFNASGLLVKSYGQISNYPFEVDLSNCPKGAYFIIISGTIKTFDFKVILK